MMEKLLKLASLAADQAEVYYQEETVDSLAFSDGKLDNCDSALSSGIALRVIKNGKMGLAHTRNLLNREALVKQALLSAENGVEVDFLFPHTQDPPRLELYRPSIETISKENLIEKGNRIIDYVRARIEGQINVSFGYGTGSSGILNSAGTELSARFSGFSTQAMLVFPGTGSGLFTFKTGRDLLELQEADLDELIELFQLSQNEIVPPTKKLPVIFTPISLFALLSRFSAASSPVNIYNRVSPLCGKLGEQIVSEKLSLNREPFDLELGSAASFDDEGTPTRRLTLIDRGVFSAFPTDLNYAAKMNLEPNGCAVRQSVESLPMAHAGNLALAPGDASMAEMISGIKEGILVQFLMGAHSGNVLYGDYSVGVSTGFMVENGCITGRVKDCLLSGNAYETLSKVEAVENKALNLGSHKLPSLLCKDVSVAGK